MFHCKKKEKSMSLKMYDPFNRQSITCPFLFFPRKHRIKFGAQTQWLIHPRCLIIFISLSLFKDISNSFGNEARHNQFIYVNKHICENMRGKHILSKYADNIFHIYFQLIFVWTMKYSVEWNVSNEVYIEFWPRDPLQMTCKTM